MKNRNLTLWGGLGILAGLVICLAVGFFVRSATSPALYAEEPKNEGPKADEPKPDEQPAAKGGDEAAQNVLDSMYANRKSEATIMVKMGGKEVLVLGAKADDPDKKKYFDQVEKVLDALNIPFTPVTIKDLEDYDFNDVAAVLCNCLDGDLTPKAIESLKNFLAKGGYLFTTDWSIDSVINKVSPGYIRTTGHGKSGGMPPNMGQGGPPAGGPPPQRVREEVPVKPFPQSKDHIFLRDIFPKGGSNFKWVLDQGFKCFGIEKKNEANVTTLIVDGEEMMKEYKTDLIAVCWVYDTPGGYNPRFTGFKESTGDYVNIQARPKKGVLMHVCSHFFMQSLGLKDVKGNSSMYQLVANFLIDARLSRNARLAKKK